MTGQLHEEKAAHVHCAMANGEVKSSCGSDKLPNLELSAFWVQNIFLCENIPGSSRKQYESTSAAKNFLLYWAINKV